MKRAKFILILGLTALLIAAIIKIADWRVKNFEKHTQKELINELSNFIDAINIEALNELAVFEDQYSRPTFQRLHAQLTAYQKHFPDSRIYGLTLKDGVPVVFISSKSELNNTVGNTLSFSDSIVHKVFVNAQIAITEYMQPDQKMVFTVLMPILDKDSDIVKVVAAMDVPAAPIKSEIKRVRLISIWSSVFFIIVILLFIGVIAWRDRQNITIRKKMRHTETIGIFLLGILVTFYILDYYKEFIYRENEVSFQNNAKNQASSIRSSFAKIRNGIETFRTYIENSEVVSSDEFESFSSYLMNDITVESIAYFEAENDSISDNLLRINSSSKKAFVMKYNHHSDDGFHFPEKFSPAIQVQITKTIDNVLRDNIVQSTSIIHLLVEGEDQHYLLLLTPVRKMIAKSDAIRKTEIEGIVAVLVSPQRVLNETLRQAQWLKEMIVVELVNYDSLSQIEWIANLPTNHMEAHIYENGIDHLKKFDYFLELQLFYVGELYGILIHSTKFYDDQNGNLNFYLIIAIGLLITIIFAILVGLIRNRWLLLETQVEQRTKSLNRRVKDLTCIKKTNEIIQSGISTEEVLQKIPKLLYETLDKTAMTNVSIEYKGRIFSTEGDNSQCDGYLKSPLVVNGAELGKIEIFSCSKEIFQIEDQQLMDQIASDINLWLEHCEMSEALKESETKFRGLIENAFDAIYTLEGKQFTYVNKAFVDMVGYSFDELTNASFDFNVLLTEKSREIVQKRFKLREQGSFLPQRYEFQQYAKDGHIIDVEVSTVRIELSGKVVIIGMMHDITSRKQAELAIIENEELLQQQNEELQVLNEELSESNNKIRRMNLELLSAKEKAEASDQLKTAFLNNISHEVRTPLNGIMGATMLLADPDISIAEREDLAGVMQQSTKRLIRTITQYMDISLLNSGNMPVYLDEVNVFQLVEPLKKEFTLECTQKQLKFELEVINVEEKLIIRTDKELVEKVLLHLLENAVKFTSSGSISLQIKYFGDNIQFAVKDTGIGIDKAFHANVFGNFVQEDQGNKRRFDGSGLGLAICKSICALLHAKIWFESEKRKGTTFYVNIPTKALTIESTDKQSNIKTPDMNTQPIILIAEDEDSNYMVLNMLLKKKINAMVLRAINGEQAVNMCNENNDIQLVLMDIKMPVMDGYEATRIIKTIRPKLPIIAITAYGLSGDEHRALSVGCDDYIAKPIQTMELFEKIDFWLHKA